MAQLAAWQSEFGTDEIICQAFAAGMQHEDAMRSIELLVCEVMPKFGKNFDRKQENRFRDADRLLRATREAG